MIEEFYVPNVRDLKPSVYNNEPCIGHFALESKNAMQWVKCREEFNKKLSSDDDGFYFCHSPFESRGVSSFLNKTEKIISLNKEIESSKFQFTENASILWVSPSKFWMECSMRRQFLTIILRCGLAYVPALDNYEKALWSRSYTKDTYWATCRFLFGFTEFISNEPYKGWVDFFGHKDLELVRKSLLNSKKLINFVGLGSVWQ